MVKRVTLADWKRHLAEQDAKPAAQRERYITADTLRLLAQMQANFEEAMRLADEDRRAGRVFRPSVGTRGLTSRITSRR